MASTIRASPNLSTIELYDYELPVPESDVESVANVLRDNDVFCPGPTAADIYSWRACRKAHADGIAVVALLDRNILNDVVALARTAIDPRDKPVPERARFGAAVMAYLLCGNVFIDPG